VRSGHAKRSRSAVGAGLLVKHTCFRPFSNGNLVWDSGVHVRNRANLEREAGSNAKSNPFLGRWNVRGRNSRSYPQKCIGHVIWNARWRWSNKYTLFENLAQSINTDVSRDKYSLDSYTAETGVRSAQGGECFSRSGASNKQVTRSIPPIETLL
jgi:hypothetical protein